MPLARDPILSVRFCPASVPAFRRQRRLLLAFISARVDAFCLSNNGNRNAVPLLLLLLLLLLLPSKRAVLLTDVLNIGGPGDAICARLSVQKGASKTKTLEDVSSSPNAPRMRVGGSSLYTSVEMASASTIPVLGEGKEEATDDNDNGAEDTTSHQQPGWPVWGTTMKRRGNRFQAG